MPGRSLVACSEGIDKAKKALQRCNLTQTAIAKELAIASWSTVSKFFNGKPVDRAIFMEICFQLNLDWQEIVGTLEEIETEVESEDTNTQHVESIIEEAFTKATPASVDLEILWSNAGRTRQALNPYILPTIRREKLLDKCLTQIQVGLDGKKRVLPILGTAGYGKSTILGTIYDELSRNCLETNTGWVALARCDDLVESAENFVKELGEKVSDRRTRQCRVPTIIEVAQQLFNLVNLIPRRSLGMPIKRL
jgi:signal recognition particle GTPase